jgi:hypothetical protein
MRITVRELRLLIREADEALTPAQLERRQALLDALEEKREEEEERKRAADKFGSMTQAAREAPTTSKHNDKLEEPVKRQLLVRTTKSTSKGQR